MSIANNQVVAIACHIVSFPAITPEATNPGNIAGMDIGQIKYKTIPAKLIEMAAIQTGFIDA